MYREIRVLDVIGEGELDAYSSSLLWHSIDEALSRSNSLILDLRDVVFIDSAGVRTLLTAHHKAIQRGVDLSISNPCSQIVNVFGQLGLGHLLARICPSLRLP